MQMYFTEFAHFMPEAVNNQGKPTYTSPETFLGGSPYEQIFQHENVVVALYNMPEGATHEHVNGFFSKDLKNLEEDASGWIFAQGGNTYIAYYPMAPYEWIPLENGGKRLYSPHRSNGTILQPASADDFESWEAFKAAVRALPLEVETDGAPSVRFTTLSGNVIRAAYGEDPTVDGFPVDFAGWPLFGSPFLEAAEGSNQLLMRHGNLERLIDFKTLQITDRVHEKPANRAKQRLFRPTQPQ
jgi:hypothetical protein